MADDTREKDKTAPGAPPATVVGAASEPVVKYPKGVVLGPDGKP